MRFPTILAIGAAAIDRVATTEACPARAATSNPGRVRAYPGGAARNVAEALARLGVPVRLVARVGEDADAEVVLAATARAGVDISAVLRMTGEATASYLAVHDGGGDIVVGVADMAIVETMPADHVRDALRQAPDALVFADANLGGDAMAAIAASGRTIAASAISVEKSQRIKPLFGRMAALFLNRYEAAALSGHAPEHVAGRVADLARIAPRGVLGLGAAGALAWEGDRTVRYDALPVQVSSTNGAGDTLAAATLAGWRLGVDFVEAAGYGMRAAALTVASPYAVSPALDAKALFAHLAPPSAAIAILE